MYNCLLGDLSEKKSDIMDLCLKVKSVGWNERIIL